MNKKYTLIFLFIFVFSLFSTSQEKVNQDLIEFNKVIQEFVNDSELSNSSISFYAVDINSGEIIGQYNPNLLLAPASTMKLFTTSAALEILGQDYIFKTTFSYTGNIDNEGTLHGNIIINGGGDPTFYSSSFLSYYTNPDVFSRVYEGLNSAGIKKIKGAVIGNSTYYSDNNVPSTWIEADVANYYGASPFALTVQDNEYKLFFNTGSKTGDSTYIIKVEPQIPNLVLANFVKSQNIKDDRSVIFGGLWDNYRIVTGSLPFQSSNFEVKGSIPDPPLFAAYLLQNLLIGKGIGISDSCKSIPGRSFIKTDSLKQINILTVQSPPLSDIIKKTNIKSVNLYAEHLLRQVGLKKNGEGSNNSGTSAIMDYWSPKTGKFIMYDGSGLSRFNAVSSKQLVTILLYMKKESKYFDTFYNSLPVAAKSGSLSNMFAGTYAENNLRAKSGYMSGVRSYAGYVKSKSNRNIAFAIIINNYVSSPYLVKSRIEQLLVKLSTL